MAATSIDYFMQFVTILGTCTSDQCRRSAEMISKNMNTNFHPCENFYKYACGNFEKNHPRPPYKKHISYDRLREQEILDKVFDFYRTTNLSAYPNLRKLYGLYAQCMNEKPYGLEAIAHSLQMIGLPVIPPFHAQTPAWFDESFLLARIHRYYPTAAFLFNVDIYTDPQDLKSNRILFGHTPRASNAPISASGEASSEFEATHEEIFEALKKHISSTVNFMYEQLRVGLGPQQILLKNMLVIKVAEFLLELDKAVNIDRHCLFENVVYIPEKEFQPWTTEILRGGVIQINWNTYFGTLFQNVITPKHNLINRNVNEIMVKSLPQLQYVLRVLQKTSREVLVGAMWFIIVRSTRSFSPKPLQDITDEFERTVFKTPEIKPSNIMKQETCSELFQSMAGALAGYILATSDPGLKNKNAVMSMAEAVRNGLYDIIQETSWLDEVTRSRALKKLNNITTFVGVSDAHLDLRAIENAYKDVTLEASCYLTFLKIEQNSRAKQLGFILSQNKFETRNTIAKCPLLSQATYSQQYVHLAISSALLEFPFFELKHCALEYAAVGSQIGHEFGHAFESNGQRYNSFGQYELWMSDESKKEYQKRKECFQESYDNMFFNSIKKYVNGYSTVEENIADSIGFAAALRAYKNVIAYYGQEQLLVNLEQFTFEKLFTLGFANIWCENATPQHTLATIETDIHSPQPARVNGVMMNSKDFARIWSCPEGSPMNPKKKCEIFS